MKKWIPWGAGILCVILFALLPFPTSDLILRVTFGEAIGGPCQLYYALDGSVFAGDAYLDSETEPGSHTAFFRLDGSLEHRLSGLRLDLPEQQSLISVTNVTVSSGGILRKEFNPCDFFSEARVLSANSIAISLIQPNRTAYLDPNGSDPYIVLSPELVAQIAGYYSHRRLSRLLLGLFLLACGFLAQKRSSP